MNNCIFKLYSIFCCWNQVCFTKCAQCTQYIFFSLQSQENIQQPWKFPSLVSLPMQYQIKKCPNNLLKVPQTRQTTRSPSLPLFRFSRVSRSRSEVLVPSISGKPSLTSPTLHLTTIDIPVQSLVHPLSVKFPEVKLRGVQTPSLRWVQWWVLAPPAVLVSSSPGPGAPRTSTASAHLSLSISIFCM